MIEYDFVASQIYSQYTREILTFQNILSNLGGIFSSLKSVGFMFTAVFSYQLMMSSLIGKLFHFKPRFPQEIKKKKPKKKNKHATESEDLTETLVDEEMVNDENISS